MRVQGLLDASNVFFVDGVMSEVACEGNGKCDTDQMSFKAYLARWMAATTKMAPFTFDAVQAKLASSATAAAQQCSGGNNGRMCGLKWTNGATWDGTSGVGQEMSALEVIQSNLIQLSPGPVTNSTGGTSVGNPLAGSNGDSTAATLGYEKISTGDRVGAGFLTLVILIVIIGGAWWMIV